MPSRDEILKPRPNEFLRIEVGSSSHGVAVDGTDDLDLMALEFESLEDLVRKDATKSLMVRTAAHGERSGPDDIDLTVHSLRRWMRLALKGNPTVLLALFAPKIHGVDPYAGALRGMASLIVSRQAGRAFLGYMAAQLDRMGGLRGGRRKPRAEHVGPEGYDSKYAMHVARLGLQGIELLTTGRLELPMSEENRELCRAVRKGAMPINLVLELLGGLEDRLKAAMSEDNIRAEPDAEACWTLVGAMHEEWWGR